MKHLHPRLQPLYYGKMTDPEDLSLLLDQLIRQLSLPPIGASYHSLAADTRIPAHIIERLANAHRDPADIRRLRAKDFHILLTNILAAYPTARLFQQAGDGFVVQI